MRSSVILCDMGSDLFCFSKFKFYLHILLIIIKQNEHKRMTVEKRLNENWQTIELMGQSVRVSAPGMYLAERHRFEPKPLAIVFINTVYFVMYQFALLCSGSWRIDTIRIRWRGYSCQLRFKTTHFVFSCDNWQISLEYLCWSRFQRWTWTSGWWWKVDTEFLHKGRKIITIWLVVYLKYIKNTNFATFEYRFSNARSSINFIGIHSFQKPLVHKNNPKTIWSTTNIKSVLICNTLQALLFILCINLYS